jgi:hypothetical protein
MCDLHDFLENAHFRRLLRLACRDQSTALTDQRALEIEREQLLRPSHAAESEPSNGSERALLVDAGFRERRRDEDGLVH